MAIFLFIFVCCGHLVIEAASVDDALMVEKANFANAVYVLRSFSCRRDTDVYDIRKNLLLQADALLKDSIGKCRECKKNKFCSQCLIKKKEHWLEFLYADCVLRYAINAFPSNVKESICMVDGQEPDDDLPEGLDRQAGDLWSATPRCVQSSVDNVDGQKATESDCVFRLSLAGQILLGENGLAKRELKKATDHYLSSRYGEGSFWHEMKFLNQRCRTIYDLHYDVLASLEGEMKKPSQHKPSPLVRAVSNCYHYKNKQFFYAEHPLCVCARVLENEKFMSRCTMYLSYVPVGLSHNSHIEPWSGRITNNPLFQSDEPEATNDDCVHEKLTEEVGAALAWHERDEVDWQQVFNMSVLRQPHQKDYWRQVLAADLQFLLTEVEKTAHYWLAYNKFVVSEIKEGVSNVARQHLQSLCFGSPECGINHGFPTVPIK